MKRTAANGLNIWALLGMFKKRTKLRYAVPEEVIVAVCQDYLSRGTGIESPFVYFLRVLKSKSEQYFSRQNEREGQRYKDEPLAIKNIMQELAKR